MLLPLNMGGYEVRARYGGVGGAEFPPWAASIQVLEGPKLPADEGAQSRSLRWRLRVAGVSPYFLRNVVDLSSGAKVKSMSITGSLPLDASPLSVREAHVRAWLDDENAYMKAWPDPGFAVVEKETPKGSTVKVKLAQEASDDVEKAFRDHVYTWHGAVGMYVSAKKGPTGRIGTQTAFPTFGRTKKELLAKHDHFDHVRGPSRDALVCVLAHFHHAVAKIDKVEIGLPG
jgi:hypothetical protein